MADEVRDGAARCPGTRGRRGRHPRRDRHARALPRADVRDSTYAGDHPSTSAEWVGLAAGGIISIASIYVAFVFYVRRRGITLDLRDRYRRVHTFLWHKWYFDELYDAVFVRPAATAGSFGRRVVETDFVQGFIVSGATGVVRAGTSLARAIRPDSCAPTRCCCSAPPPCSSTSSCRLVTIHLSIIIFLPLAAGLIGAALPRGYARWAVLAGTVAVLAYTIVLLADFDSGARGLQYVTDDEWIPEAPASATSSGSTASTCSWSS